MNFDSLPSPARVSAAAARPFPRAALLALLAVFIVSGLIGRDPWYQEDAAGFGVMWTMAHGTVADWLLPNIAGEFIGDGGPLAGWVGALFIRAFGGWFGDALAARLTVVLWFVLSTATLWYATYRLGRRAEAQPVAFAFGGEAQPRDYGRMLADIALLLLIGTLGLVIRVHETTDLAASVALSGLTVFALTLALERAWAGAALAGAAIGLMALARGPHAALFLALGALFALAFTLPAAARWRAVVLALATACTVFALWPLAALSAPDAARAAFFSAWAQTAQSVFGAPNAADLGWLARTLAWYLWPLWPFALWALYAWRHGFARAHIAIPMAMGVAFLAGALASPQNEPPLLLLAAPLAVLAAFGAVSVKRATENAIDWFAIVTASFFALVGWAYFIAMLTGTPPKMAASIARLAPGYAPQIGPLEIALALAATAGWIALAIWRVMRQPEPLWRGPLLAAGGLTALWFMLNVLFLPAINYVRSYAPIAHRIEAQIEKTAAASACVFAYQLRPAHRALLAFHGGIRFGAAQDDCPLALMRDLRRTHLDDAPPPGEWRVLWEGHWDGRPNETFRLFRRASH